VVTVNNYVSENYSNLQCTFEQYSESVRHWFLCVPVGYNLKDPGITFQFQVGTKDFSLFQSIQASSGVYPAFYSVGTGMPEASYMGVEWSGHEADQSPPYSAEVKNT
jgi:hypothetical protein